MGIESQGDEVVATYIKHRGLRHTDDGSVVFIRSHDGGRTWDAGTHTVAMRQHADWGFTSAGVQLLRDGTVLALGLSNLVVGHRSGSESRFRHGYIARSTDGGKTWRDPEIIDAWPMRGAAVWDDPLELADGTLLLAAYGAFQDPKTVGTVSDPSRNVLLWSEDQGRNWACYGTIAYDPAGLHHFYEPGIAQAPDGRLVALSRHRHAVFGNVPPGGYLFFSESEDEGVSWTPFRRTDVWGYPADLVTLQDGSILSVYGHRKDPMSVKVVVSEDGRQWSEANSIVLYEAPNYDGRGPVVSKRAIDSGYRHIGYPSATVLDDGTVLAAFHSFDEERKQIVLLARFRAVRN